MADKVTAKAEAGAEFTPAPEGQYQAVCVDVLDMGLRVEQFGDNPERLVHKVVLVWQLDVDNPDTGKRFEVSKEFTLSFNEKASLRKVLGAWRGKSYSEAEAAKGVPLDKLEGQNALVSVEHKVSRNDRTYANLLAISPLPKGMAKIKAEGYVRGDYWQARKDDYAKAAAAFGAPKRPVPAGSLDDFPAALQDPDDGPDLPF